MILFVAARAVIIVEHFALVQRLLRNLDPSHLTPRAERFENPPQCPANRPLCQHGVSSSAMLLSASLLPVALNEM
jgi:hypothetical protein